MPNRHPNTSDSAFADVDARLTGRCQESRKVANNTYLQRREEGRIALKLHQTDIILWDPNGTMVLNSGGWKTKVTKDRLNQYLPRHFQISNDKGVWYMGGSWSDRSQSKVFQDGIIIRPDGTVENAGSHDPKMDIGYWLNNGFYEPPEDGFRRDVLASMACDLTEVFIKLGEKPGTLGVYGRNRPNESAILLNHFPTKKEAEDFADMIDGLIPNWYFTVDYAGAVVEEYGPYDSRFDAEQGIINIQRDARRIGDAKDRTYSAPYRKP